MIVADGFIFVLNPKCASTSILAALRGVGVNVGQRHTPLSEPPSKPLVACVVRDDESRLRSAWRKSTPSFEAWKAKTEGDPWIAFGETDIRDVPQSTWLRHVNTVLHFDNLADDWRKFCDLAGIGARLLHLNKGQ